MIQLLLRTLLVQRQSRQAAPPSYRQALLELPLRLLQQGGEAPLLDLLPLLAQALEAKQACLLLPAGTGPGWRRVGEASGDAGCVGHVAQLPAAGGGCNSVVFAWSVGIFKRFAGCSMKKGVARCC